MGPMWNDKPLVLQIDHINGVSNDNRIENLQILCPNCHTQTVTFAGRRFKKHKDKNTNKNPNWRKKPRPHKRKVEWPSKNELSSLLKNNSWVSIGRMYKVSDNAVRKWAKHYNLMESA